MKTLIFILLPNLPFVAFPQWSTLGTNIYNTNSGYVGVGLQLPTAKLHTQQGSNTDWATYFTNLGGEGKGLRIQAAGNLNSVAIPLFQIDDNYGFTKLTVTSNSRVHIGNVTNLNSSNIKFYVLTRVDSVVNGRLPDAGFKTSVKGYIKSTNQGFGVVGWADQTGTPVTPNISVGVAGLCSPSNAYAGFFYGNLGYSGSLGQASDQRLKENIRDVDGSLNRIMDLRPKSFSFKQPNNFGLPYGEHVGFLAQDVQKIFPTLVSDVGIPYPPVRDEGILINADSSLSQTVMNQEKFLTLDYVQMIPYIVRAIQEQHVLIQKQSESLKLLINALASFSGDENKSQYLIQVFPNPASGQVEIDITPTASDPVANVEVRMYDKDGTPLLSKVTSQNKTLISISSYQSGVYFLAFFTKGEMYDVKRLIIDN